MSKVSRSCLMAGLAGVAFGCSAPALADGGPAIWSGLYVGAHGGYGEASDEPAPFDVSGGVLGMHLGYNYQMGSAVLGIEGDYSGSSLEDTARIGADRVSLEVDDFASIRARAGLTFGNALVYGTVGYAWADAGTSGRVGGVSFSRSTDFDGLVAGAGLEYKFAADWSARIEGLHYWLEPDANGQDIDDLDAAVVRAGVTWHFNSN